MKNPLLFNYGIDALTTRSALVITGGEFKAELIYHIIDSWK
jgi:hypothetical protein